jgi:hypothetical protein
MASESMALYFFSLRYLLVKMPSLRLDKEKTGLTDSHAITGRGTGR